MRKIDPLPTVQWFITCFKYKYVFFSRQQVIILPFTENLVLLYDYFFYFQDQNDPLKIHVTPEYLEEMRRNGTFADEIVIRALSSCLKKDICIVTSSEDPDFIWTVIEGQGSTGSPFLLGHLGE